VRQLPLRRFLLGACVAAAGCEDTTSLRPDATAECTEASSSAGDLAASLSAARTRWEQKGIHDYALSRSVYCECRFVYEQPLTARVINHRVVWIRDAKGTVLPSESFRDFTVEHFFAEIEQILQQAPDFARACFDADLGYPRELYVDYDSGTADEEYSYNISLKLVE
jgi:hypothetical protein